MTLSAEDKNIKIPTNHYVGFQARQGEAVPLGFMTPDGTDSAATKRKATVDNWAKGYGRTTTLPPKSFENKPMSGFKLGRNVRHGHGWGQGNVKWRIEDPRGFELEISSPNLAQIMAFSTIERGEILDKCVWGRLKNENILIPVTSDVYKAAEANTERAGKSASLKDLEPGNYIVLQNGEEGTYMGAFFTMSAGGYGTDRSLKWGDKKRHIFKTKAGAYEVKASMKLSEITDPTKVDIADYEKELNEFLKGKGRSLYEPGNDYRTMRAVSVTSLKKSDVTMVLEKHTVAGMLSDCGKNSYGHRESTGYVSFINIEVQGQDKWALFEGSSVQRALDEHATRTASFAANPSYYGGRTPEVGEVHFTVFDKAKFDADGELVMEMTTTGHSYNRYDRELSIGCKANAIPESLYRLKVSGKTGSGQDYEFYY